MEAPAYPSTAADNQSTAAGSNTQERLCQSGELPTGAEYANQRPYGARGWCFVEQRLSALVKDDKCLWDLGAYKETMTTFVELLGMKAGRPPFMSPERVARELREGVASGAIAFTAASDVDVVIELHTRGFVSAFETFCDVRENGNIYYEDLGIGDDDFG